MLDKIIAYSREDGGISVVHPAYRGRLATMWIYRNGPGLVYFDAPAFGQLLAAPGDLVPSRISDSEYEIALAAGAFESDDAFLARLLRDAVPAGATGVVLPRSALPATRADRHLWRLTPGGISLAG